MVNPAARATIFTIGHSRHAAEHFLALLAQHEIEVVVDVRSSPASGRSPHFNKRALRQALREHGLAYVFLGRSLGGRPAGRQFYDTAGRLDCARRARDQEFLASLEELLQLAAEQRVVLLCAEEDPQRCHRWLLIGKALVARGVSIVHIRGDATAQPAERGEQLTLFGLPSP